MFGSIHASALAIMANTTFRCGEEMPFLAITGNSNVQYRHCCAVKVRFALVFMPKTALLAQMVLVHCAHHRHQVHLQRSLHHQVFKGGPQSIALIHRVFTKYTLQLHRVFTKYNTHVVYSESVRTNTLYFESSSQCALPL